MGEFIVTGLAVGFGWFLGAIAWEFRKRSIRRKKHEVARAKRKKAHVWNHEDFNRYN